MPRAIALQGNFTAPFSVGPLVFEHGLCFRTDCGLLSRDEMAALMTSGEAAMLLWLVDVPEDTVGWTLGPQMGAAGEMLVSLLASRGALLHRVPSSYGTTVLLVNPTKAVGVRSTVSNNAAWRSMLATAARRPEEARRWAEVAYAVAPTMTPSLVALLSEALRAVGEVKDAEALVQMEVNSKVL